MNYRHLWQQEAARITFWFQKHQMVRWPYEKNGRQYYEVGEILDGCPPIYGGQPRPDDVPEPEHMYGVKTLMGERLAIEAKELAPVVECRVNVVFNDGSGRYDRGEEVYVEADGNDSYDLIADRAFRQCDAFQYIDDGKKPNFSVGMTTRIVIGNQVIIPYKQHEGLKVVVGDQVIDRTETNDAICIVTILER